MQFERHDYSNKVLKCLIMSGGEGSGNMTKIAKTLLKHYDCKLKIITGRNKVLKKKLEKSFYPEYSKKVQIYGFTDKINELMFSSDILFARGSPNVMMEAVCSNIPLVITDVLPGQEEGNLYYAQKNNIGVVCTDYKKIKAVLDDLLVNESEKLNSIRESQFMLRDQHIAENIVNFLLNLNKKSEVLSFDMQADPLVST
jgi:processive 1,2-diacylglycerol beta-glucosyltransferase